MNQLLEVKDSGRFESIMSYTSCLTTIAVCDSTDDASRLIDFVRGLRLVGFRVAKTQLFVMVPSFEYGLLQKVQNISINFNVMILENGAGTVEYSKFVRQNIFFYFIIRKHEGNSLSLPCFGQTICTTPQWYMPMAFAASNWEKYSHIFHWHLPIHHLLPYWWPRF